MLFWKNRVRWRFSAVLWLEKTALDRIPRYKRTALKEECLYIEVAKGAIFMEQNMRFGLILGLLAILKKNLGRLWATFEAVFFMFSWAKKKDCIVRTKKLHYLSFIKFLFLIFF